MFVDEDEVEDEESLVDDESLLLSFLPDSEDFSLLSLLLSLGSEVEDGRDAP